MRKWVVFVLLVAACGGSTPASYVGRYGGLESQYEAIASSEDCRWLGETAAAMDARYDADKDRVALGYQKAAVDRMQALNCP